MLRSKAYMTARSLDVGKGLGGRKVSSWTMFPRGETTKSMGQNHRVRSTKQNTRWGCQERDKKRYR